MNEYAILRDVSECKTRLIGSIKSGYMAYWLIRTNTHISDKVPTAGVNYDGRRFNLIINPNFWNSLTPDNKCFVLEHEIYHLICGHVFSHSYGGTKNRYKDKNHELRNIAEDICINQWCFKDSMVKEAMLPEQFNFPPNKTSAEYYEMLLTSDKVKFVKGYAAGENFFDTEGCSPEEAQALHESITREAYARNPGTQPAEIDRLIEHIKNKSKINWKKILRQYLGIIPADIRYRRKYNKKHNPEYIVKKKKYKTKLLVGVDVSGSITVEMVQAFFSEIDKIYKEAEVDVVCCDTQITEYFKYDGKPPKTVKGGGGTILQPICDFYQKGNYNALIVITDGYFDGVTCTKSSLWLYTETKDFIVRGAAKKIPFDLNIK